jgi:trehalose 6-phosphate synthase/phosphatase
MDMENKKRVINVSNRLPVKLTLQDGKLIYQQSEGGLATGLSSVFNSGKSIWIGWPGAVVPETEQDAVTFDLAAKCLYPVYLTTDEISKYYEGFSNETLWPLFHYFPTFSKYCQQYWDSYVAVNKKFADAIVTYAKPDDIVWIQDYQLMLVPAMVRAILPDITIGYFQHIPFPDYEIFRALPWKKEILKGLLGADTIGFQTEDDERHFVNTACRILDLDVEGKEFNIDDRTVTVDAFPISIDYKKFRELATHQHTKTHARKIKELISNKIALSIDRLVYSKGILQRLRAYDLFLEKHPECHQQITFVHLVVPSRDNVNNYRELKEEMNKLISNINGKYATFGCQFIHHFYRSFPPHMLSALYSTADLAMVTPLRDGMNLVSKEYVASNTSLNGVLLLSEAAGAAKELTDALIVNPNDIQAYANKIYEALNMPEAEKAERMLKMQQVIERSDIFMWSESFMSKLIETVNRKTMNVCTPLDALIKGKFEQEYLRASKRLLLLDYDGTLVPFHNKPEEAFPDGELLNILGNLASDRKNNIAIISGRDRVTLENWLGHLPVELVGEHGAWDKEPGKKWQSIEGLSAGWKKEVNNIFINYSDDAPGSFIEEKTYSTAWHYRNAEGCTGEKAAAAIIRDLKSKLKNQELDIIDGNKVVEVKSSLVNKGNAALRLLAKQDYDFVIAIGDDRTDEDMFKALPADTITIKVGANISAADYWQKSVTEVRALLERFNNSTCQFTDNSSLVVLLR